MCRTISTQRIGTPVEFRDHYTLLDDRPPPGPPAPNPQGYEFASYSDRIADVVPGEETLPCEATPFPVQRVRKGSQLQFNVADYAHTLMADFLAGGGRVERAGGAGDVLLHAVARRMGGAAPISRSREIGRRYPSTAGPRVYRNAERSRSICCKSNCVRRSARLTVKK